MPLSVETRVLQGLLAAAIEASGENVSEDQHYARDVLAYSPDRDGIPAVVVARTPGRNPVQVKKLSWCEWVYPFTAMLLDSTTGTVASGESSDWRTAWVDAFLTAVDGPSPFNDEELDEPVTEVHWVDPDTLVQLDLTAFEQAGLWKSAASVLVTVRVPY